jgi:hypothetical protein
VGTGNFYLRLDPELLGQVRKTAEAEGLTVSDFIREGIRLKLAQAGIPRSVTRESLLAEIASTAAMLGKGYVLVPSAEALPPGDPGSWSDLMGGGER